jgi:hypothetical protein
MMRHSLRGAARAWLLMAQDRLGGDEVPLTHEFLSLMLGVPPHAFWLKRALIVAWRRGLISPKLTDPALFA